MKQIFITQEAFKKMHYYIAECDQEISGLGEVKKDHGNLLVTDVFIFNQDVTGTHTELDKGSLALFLEDYNNQGKDIADIKLWWHSHVNMSAYFSPTDTANIERLSDTFPWAISIVGNKKNEFQTRVDVFDPLRITKEDLELTPIFTDEEMRASIKSEIGEKVNTSLSFLEKRKRKNKKDEEKPTEIIDPSYLDPEYEGSMLKDIVNDLNPSTVK